MKGAQRRFQTADVALFASYRFRIIAKLTIYCIEVESSSGQISRSFALIQRG